MRPQLVLVHDQDPFECFGVPESVLREPALAPEPAPPVLPGASRRDWVYREISQLGADAAPWVMPERG
jgi:hypothetical protein